MNGATRSAAALLLALAALAAGCGGDGGNEPAETKATEAAAGDPARGKEIYLTRGCGACHTFKPAGSTRNVGPNLDRAAELYDAAFMRESLVDPKAFIEKGESGSIGGKEPYGTRMPAYGPDEDPPQTLTEQELADLVAFLLIGKEKK